MDVRELVLENAFEPIDKTLSGIVMVVMDVASEKALLPIDVIEPERARMESSLVPLNAY